jgi:hypothetical protein
LENDPWEEHNLMLEEIEELQNIKNKFREFSMQFPDEDAVPRYTPLEGSVYNIEESDLNKIARDGMRRPNRSPDI